jgi:hypothetical protein
MGETAWPAFTYSPIQSTLYDIGMSRFIPATLLKPPLASSISDMFNLRRTLALARYSIPVLVVKTSTYYRQLEDAHREFRLSSHVRS